MQIISGSPPGSSNEPPHPLLQPDQEPKEGAAFRHVIGKLTGNVKEAKDSVFGKSDNLASVILEPETTTSHPAKTVHTGEDLPFERPTVAADEAANRQQQQLPIRAEGLAKPLKAAHGPKHETEQGPGLVGVQRLEEMQTTVNDTSLVRLERSAFSHPAKTVHTGEDLPFERPTVAADEAANRPQQQLPIRAEAAVKPLKAAHGPKHETEQGLGLVGVQRLEEIQTTVNDTSLVRLERSAFSHPAKTVHTGENWPFERPTVAADEAVNRQQQQLPIRAEAAVKPLKAAHGPKHESEHWLGLGRVGKHEAEHDLGAQRLEEIHHLPNDTSLVRLERSAFSHPSKTAHTGEDVPFERPTVAVDEAANRQQQQLPIRAEAAAKPLEAAHGPKHEAEHDLGTQRLEEVHHIPNDTSLVRVELPLSTWVPSEDLPFERATLAVEDIISKSQHRSNSAETPTISLQEVKVSENRPGLDHGSSSDAGEQRLEEIQTTINDTSLVRLERSALLNHLPTELHRPRSTVIEGEQTDDIVETDGLRSGIRVWGKGGGRKNGYRVNPDSSIARLNPTESKNISVFEDRISQAVTPQSEPAPEQPSVLDVVPPIQKSENRGVLHYSKHLTDGDERYSFDDVLAPTAPVNKGTEIRVVLQSDDVIAAKGQNPKSDPLNLESLGLAVHATNTTPKTSPVILSDAATMDVPVGNKEWSDTFTSRVLWQVRENLQRASIRLNPAELGSIEVNINLDKDQAYVQFVVQHSAARDAIEDAMPRLRELLSNAGLQLADSNVSQHSSNSTPDPQTSANQERSPTASTRLTEQEDEGEEALVTAGAVQDTAGLINTYV